MIRFTYSTHPVIIVLVIQKYASSGTVLMIVHLSKGKMYIYQRISFLFLFIYFHFFFFVRRTVKLLLGYSYRYRYRYICRSFIHQTVPYGFMFVRLFIYVF